MNRAESWEPHPGAATPFKGDRKRGAMADSQFWHGLEAQFRVLSQPFDLRVDWHSVLDSNDVKWRIVGTPEASCRRFENLARRAGAAISNSADADSLDAWLRLLRQQSKNPHDHTGLAYSQNPDGTRAPVAFGTIPSVCEASANLCIEFKTEAEEELRRIEAVIATWKAQQSPQDQARLLELSKTAEASVEYMKDVLWRLGVRTTLEDNHDLWLQIWAAARYVGFSDEEFWRLTPRKLFAVLELKATELDSRAGSGKKILRQATTERTSGGVCNTDGATLKPEQTGRKRGPKTDYENAVRVAEIVARVAPDGGWKDKLNEICVALDAGEIPHPKTWRKREMPLKNWEDGADCEPALAKKAIEHWLKVAKQRKKPTNETLS
jgi:hypothetical protein